MPGWLKTLLIVAGVLVILVVCVVGAGVFYVMKNKDAWLAKGKEAAEQGKAYGNTTDNQGCVDEGVKRYKEDRGFTGILANSLFMRACLDTSRPTPGFCDEVPKPMEFVKSAEWKLKQCRLVGLQGDSNCQNVFTPVQQFCETPYKHARENDSNN